MMIEDGNFALEKIKKLVGVNAKNVERCDDSLKCWFFNIEFIDYELQNHVDTDRKSNKSYWVSIFRKEFKVVEDFFIDEKNSFYLIIRKQKFKQK